MNELEKRYLDRLEKFFNKPMLSKIDIADFCDVSLGSVNNMMGNSDNSNEIKLKYMKFGNDKRSGIKIFIDDFAMYLARIDTHNETQ